MSNMFDPLQYANIGEITNKALVTMAVFELKNKVVYEIECAVNDTMHHKKLSKRIVPVIEKRIAENIGEGFWVLWHELAGMSHIKVNLRLTHRHDLVEQYLGKCSRGATPLLNRPLIEEAYRDELMPEEVEVSVLAGYHYQGENYTTRNKIKEDLRIHRYDDYIWKLNQQLDELGQVVARYNEAIDILLSIRNKVIEPYPNQGRVPARRVDLQRFTSEITDFMPLLDKYLRK